MDRPIVFLSDYGLDDEFVGICHAVMARLAPQAHVVDLTHAVPPQDVLRGALLLSHAVRYLPAGAVLLAVVDPGVGSDRRPVAVETAEGDHLLVGPDNGLLSLAWDAAGGAVRAAEIRAPDVVLAPMSATFHGRDVFAPAAARLASGLPLERLGPAVPPSDLIRVRVPEPAVEPGSIGAEVLGVDRFGNLQTSIRTEHLLAGGLAEEDRLVIETPRGPFVVRRASTFGEVSEGEHGAIVDSSGWLALVLNRGSAAESLGLAAGDPVTVRVPDDG